MTRAALSKKTIYILLALVVALTALVYIQPRQAYAGETEYLNDITDGKNLFNMSHYFASPDKTNISNYTFDSGNNSFSYDMPQNTESVLTGKGTYMLRPGTYTFSFYLKKLVATNIETGLFHLTDENLNSFSSVSVKNSTTTATRYSMTFTITSDTQLCCELRLYIKPLQGVSYTPLSEGQKFNVYNIQLEDGTLSGYVPFGSSGSGDPNPEPEPSPEPDGIIGDIDNWLTGSGGMLMLAAVAASIALIIIYVRKGK